MVVVIVILVLVAIGVAIGLWWSEEPPAAAGAAHAAPVDPLAEGRGGPLEGLGVGAVVAFGGHDYVVRGEIRFDEDGYVWSEYHLDAGGDERAVAVGRPLRRHRRGALAAGRRRR